MKTDKIHIYFMPGLAASSKIFEHIKLPEDKFERHYLEWLLPLSVKESIENYAKRMAEFVVEENPVLVGVSFGGIVVQEMSKHLKTRKVIIISSGKSNTEFSKRLKILQQTKAYKLFPAKVISNLEDFSKVAFGEFTKKRLALYKKYLSVRDPNYLTWAIDHVLNWQQTTPQQNIIHIHGKEDHIFPIKNIKSCITIEKGTHIMILTKAKSISEIISDIF